MYYPHLVSSLLALLLCRLVGLIYNRKNARDLKSVYIYTPFRARAMRVLVNIQTTSERADKKVWENNGLSGSNSDVVIANENSLDLAFLYPLKC